MNGTRELLRFNATVVTAAEPHVVLELLRDLPSHLEWSGRRSTTKYFRLVGLHAPSAQAEVGTRFSSTGANNNGTFHDVSIVTEVEEYRFAVETTSRLDRKHGAEWRARFSHYYDVYPTGDGGAQISYCGIVHDANYVPYWLKPGVRRLTRPVVEKMITRQLRNLARLAEERAGGRSAPP